jgi:hypothetical protein
LVGVYVSLVWFGGKNALSFLSLSCKKAKQWPSSYHGGSSSKRHNNKKETKQKNKNKNKNIYKYTS